MKLLLDTHIWLWSLREPHRLSSRVRRELRDENNELWLSPVSAWEASVLHRKARLRLHVSFREWMGTASANLREAPLTHEVVVSAQELDLLHRDPADRFLVATAQVLGLTLVTEDQRLLGLGKIATLANR